MSQRYALRFETTERRGETIPITGTRFTIGRRPGNSLQILENSVSGKHAEILIEASGVLLRDLGSTNGTRVGPEKVLEMRLRAGSEVHIGNVGLRFVDTEAPPPSGVVPAQVPQEALDELAAGSTIVQDLPEDLHFSERKIERAAKSSKLPLILLVGALAVGGAAGWYFTQGSAGAEGSAAQPVTAVPGNLLAEGFSFEGENDAWESREGAPSAFFRNGASAYSGEEGLLADLVGGEWAAHESPAARVAPGRRLTLSGVARSDAAEARLGLLFSSSSDTGPKPVSAWQSLASEDTYAEVQLVATVPVGYDRVRAVLRASAPADGDGGSVEFDDIALLEEAGDGPDVAFDEYKVYAFGDPVRSAVLAKVDQPLLQIQGLRDAAGKSIGWQVAADPKGLRVSAQAGELNLNVETKALAGGLATMGPGGYSGHSVDFERDEVTDILIGGGFDLVRVAFDQPVSLRGSKGSAGGFALSAGLKSGGFLVQVRFQEERAKAGDLASAARDAERDGRIGEALAKWTELLERFPFDERNTADAEEARGRWVRSGLEEMRAVELEIERARFFRLADLFRECRDQVADIEARYMPSELGGQAGELRGKIEGELAGLEEDLDRYEVQRLRSIATVLEATQSPRLANIVREYIENEFTASGGDR